MPQRRRRRPAVQRATPPSPASVTPASPTTPNTEIARDLFCGLGYGAVVALELKNAAQPHVFRFLEALQMVQPATTVGDIYSLVLYPSHASHRALSPAQRAAVGISDGLVRLAVGAEDPQRHHRRHHHRPRPLTNFL